MAVSFLNSYHQFFIECQRNSVSIRSLGYLLSNTGYDALGKAILKVSLRLLKLCRSGVRYLGNKVKYKVLKPLAASGQSLGILGVGVSRE